MRYLITGAAGFIGHHVVDRILRASQDRIVIIDRLDCSGNLNRLAEIGCHDVYADRVKFIYHDLRAPINELLAAQIGPVDVILHLAAATHVDRSIESPMDFVLDNIVATVNVLEFAKWCRVQGACSAMVYFSTDEVFGPAPDNRRYDEWDRYNSGNPYAASKAGAEEMCLAYHNTYNLPVMITHTMNVIGERQHPEKFVPSCISKTARGETITIHANANKTKAGSRFYIHAGRVADALLFVLSKGVSGDKYNIVGAEEIDNLQLAQLIANYVGKPLKYEMVDFHSSRPGHDLRYALNGDKLANMGWTPGPLEEDLRQTVEWTLANRQWML